MNALWPMAAVLYMALKMEEAAKWRYIYINMHKIMMASLST